MCSKFCCVMCLLKCKKELRCKNFGLGHERPTLFVTSQCGHKILYPIWTTLFAVYHTAWLVLDVVLYNGQTEGLRYLIYLTNWGFIMLTLSSICTCVVVIYAIIKRKDIIEGQTDEMTWYLRSIWVLSNIVNSGAPAITFAFYTFLTPELTAVSVVKHALNTVYVIANVFVTAMPIRLYHVYQPMLFGIMYVAFSVIYQLGFGSKSIYPILNWNDPVNTTVTSVVLAFIAVPFFHILMFCLYKLRTFISGKYCSQKDEVVENIELIV